MPWPLAKHSIFKSLKSYPNHRIDIQIPRSLIPLINGSMVEAYRKCVPQQKGRFKFNFDIAPKDNPGIAGSGGLIMDSECKALCIIKL